MEVILTKQDASVLWPSLEASDSKPAANWSLPEPPRSSYPTSSKCTVDWNKLEVSDSSLQALLCSTSELDHTSKICGCFDARVCERPCRSSCAALANWSNCLRWHPTGLVIFAHFRLSIAWRSTSYPIPPHHITSVSLLGQPTPAPLPNLT